MGFLERFTKKRDLPTGTLTNSSPRLSAISPYLLGLSWSSERLSDREDDSAAAYDANLSDRVVGDTLLEISELLMVGTKIVEGGVPERSSGPARLKEFADDLYQPEL